MKLIMKPRLVALIQIYFLICFVFTVQGQTLRLSQSHENGIYKSGQKITITATITQRTNDSLYVSGYKNNDQVLLKTAIVPGTDSFVVFEGKFKEPCSVIIEARIKEAKQKIGSIVDPLKIKPGSDCPKDFNAYWDQEKRFLNSIMMEVKSKKIDIRDSGYVCFDTEINCTGPKTVKGYFAKPEKAKVRSLPIVLVVHAAGVKGSWCRSETANALNYAKMGKGALCFDLNAHGMLNGQPDEYYNNLEAGELREYWWSGLENRDEFYFRGMYLRLLRTIEFLTRQPEWDRKRIIVIGESQGGGQALAAAGLDSRVSAVVATVPAMCDWGGTLVNRKGGWPQPFERSGDQEKMKQVLPYFDTANLLKDSKAIIVVEIGLIDNTCPATSIYAAINQAKGPKIIYPVPYREHAWPNAEQRKIWDKQVFEPKNSFVADYLK
jgi:cephalosporin-C deacetylase